MDDRNQVFRALHELHARPRAVFGAVGEPRGSPHEPLSCPHAPRGGVRTTASTVPRATRMPAS